MSDITEILPENLATADARDDTAVPWFCIRAKPRQEKIAATNLSAQSDVKIFFPRVRYTRRTRRGLKRNTEALFPGYIFAQFSPAQAKQVAFTNGVAHIIRRGNELASVPLEVMRELFLLAPENIINIAEPNFTIGQEIQIISGIFTGTKTTIIEIAPWKKRVTVLMDFLGQPQKITIDVEEIDLPDTDPRKRI